MIEELCEWTEADSDDGNHCISCGCPCAEIHCEDCEGYENMPDREIDEDIDESVHAHHLSSWLRTNPPRM